MTVDRTKAEQSAKYNTAQAALNEQQSILNGDQKFLQQAEKRLNTAISQGVDPLTNQPLTPELQLKLQQNVDTRKATVQESQASVAAAQQDFNQAKANYTPPPAETATETPKQSVADAPQPAASGSLNEEEKNNLNSANKQPQDEVPARITTFDANGNEITPEEEQANQADTDKSNDEVKQLSEPVSDNITASSAGTKEKSDTVTINPIPNLLHGYSTYTYNISLHILPIDAYDEMQKTGKYVVDRNRVLIASAGRHNDQTFARNPYWTEDFYFDNLHFSTVMGFNSRTKGSNAITLDFTIIEPYGISLLDRLIKTCDDYVDISGEKKPIENYIAVPYMLQIDFFGYNQDSHEPKLIEKATKNIAIRLLSMDMSFDAKGTLYKFSAVPYNHSAFNELNLNLPSLTNIKSKGTVESFFTSDQEDIETEKLLKQITSTEKGGIQDNVREQFKKRYKDDYKTAQETQQKKLEEWKKKNPKLSAEIDKPTGTIVIEELKKSNYPRPVPAIDDATLEKNAEEKWKEQSSNSAIYATEVNAGGLGVALNTYQKFIAKEYNLLDGNGAPILYKFSFDPEIGQSTINTKLLTDHSRKSPKADAPVKATAETATPTYPPAPATGQIVGFQSNAGGAATGVIRAPRRAASAGGSNTPPAGGSYVAVAREMLQKEEGLPKGGKAYWDPAGQNVLVSIGYGHQIQKNEYDQGFIQAGAEQIKIVGNRGIDTVLTKNQAGALLELDLPRYSSRAAGPLGSAAWAKLNDNQKAALISYAYNTGSTESLVNNGIVDAINKGDFTSAGQIIAQKGIRTANGKILPALVRRREHEGSLFSSGVTNTNSEPQTQTPTPDSFNTAASSIDTSVDSDQFISFQQGTSVIEVINTIMKASSYIQDQLQLKLDEAGAGDDAEKKAKVEREFEPYNHFKIIPKVELGKFDPVRNDYTKIITFFIKTYKVKGLRFPDIKKGTRPRDIDCVKQYNYYFTGKNTDILDLKVSFDALFYTAMSARSQRFQQATIDQAKTDPPKVGGDSAPNATIIAKHSKTLPASLQFVPNIMGNNKLTQESVEAIRANDLFGNLYGKSQADMLTLDFDIVGDPCYIQTEEFTLNPDRKDDYLDKTDVRVFDNGSLVINDGDLFVKVEFRLPLDIDTTTGLYKFEDGDLRKSSKDSSFFTGIYKILTIDHTFQGGQFKQKLQTVRVYNDPQTLEKDNQGAPDPNRDGTTGELMGPPAPVSSISQTNSNTEAASDAQLPSPDLLPTPNPLPQVPPLPSVSQVSTASGTATTTISGDGTVTTVTSTVTETVTGGGSTTTTAVYDDKGNVVGVNKVYEAAQQADRNAVIAKAQTLNIQELENLKKSRVGNESPIQEGDW
jgi:GH24 family phage-related lysozyme (muramidase)